MLSLFEKLSDYSISAYMISRHIHLGSFLKSQIDECDFLPDFPKYANKQNQFKRNPLYYDVSHVLITRANLSYAGYTRGATMKLTKNVCLYEPFISRGKTFRFWRAPRFTNSNPRENFYLSTTERQNG